MKRLLLLILCVILTMVTASCQAAAPVSAREEIVLHEWRIVDSFGKPQGSLSFSDGKMKLHAGLSDSEIDFTEQYVIDDSSITVNSNDYGVIIMKYALSGEKLSLSYGGKKITLIKKECVG